MTDTLKHTFSTRMALSDAFVNGANWLANELDRTGILKLPSDTWRGCGVAVCGRTARQEADARYNPKVARLTNGKYVWYQRGDRHPWRYSHTTDLDAYVGLSSLLELAVDLQLSDDQLAFIASLRSEAVQ